SAGKPLPPTGSLFERRFLQPRPIPGSLLFNRLWRLGARLLRCLVGFIEALLKIAVKLKPKPPSSARTRFAVVASSLSSSKLREPSRPIKRLLLHLGAVILAPFLRARIAYMSARF